jgi:hypothetical protein
VLIAAAIVAELAIAELVEFKGSDAVSAGAVWPVGVVTSGR